jgi:hypothetical protein
MGAVPPPVTCPGCGRSIDQPYPASELRFAYRLGETLRRVLDTDSLGHVLALHWFTRLLDGGLVGAHPGVNVISSSDNRTIGEADVLLLLTSGDLVPVEVKRTTAGTQGRTVELMDTLAEALGAPWDALVVTQPGREATVVQGLGRRLPERPRLLLTNDHLHADHVFWPLGGNPFAWSEIAAEEDQGRDRGLMAWLAQHDPEAPWDYVRDRILDLDLD